MPLLGVTARRSTSSLDTPMPFSFHPPPDTTKTPRYRFEVLEFAYSQNKRYRAALLRDEQGIFRICCEMWDLSAFECSGRGYWNPVGSEIPAVDTLEDARQFGSGNMRLVALSGSDV